MILRKPYKFLIKYFKIIHILLFLPILYLIIKINSVVKFFSNYVTNSYSYENISSLAGSYINLFMYLAILIIVGITLIVYYLMRQKKKNTKLYVSFIVYYIVLFVLITICHGILSDLEIKELSAQTSRAYRDLSLLFSLPQYFFAFYTIFRGLGFDIKQFKFELDLKDLDIDEKDNEEFEFVLGVETYKYKRTIRRFFREFKYYILENKFIFTCLCAITFLVISTTLYMHFNVYNKTYTTNKTFSHSAFTINMKESMITNMDYNGKVITKDKYYLVLKLYIANNSIMKSALDVNNFRLQTDDGYLVPTLDRTEYFIDYGVPYYGDDLPKNSENIYNLVYELNKDQVKRSYKLKILDNIEFKIGELNAHYKILSIKPKRVYEVEDTGNYKVNDNISLNESNLGNTKYILKNYKITDLYDYTYEKCYYSECRSVNDFVQANNLSSKVKTTLLVLDNNLELDDQIIYKEGIKTINKFYEDYFTVEVDGTEYTTKNITPTNLKDKIVLQTIDNIKSAKELNLLLTVRDKRYRIELKGV